MFRRMFGIASLALLPLAASAGTTSLIIPAAGTGAGAGNSQWETEFVIHNATTTPADFKLIWHDASGSSNPKPFVIGPRSTATTQDVVRNVFGFTQATGAIEVQFDDSLANRLVVTSRTLNISNSGEFGQDVPAINATDAPQVGEVAVLSSPDPTAFRLNFGIYAVTDATINWELVRADGSIAATKEVSYSAGTQFQYNAGVSSLLGGTAQANDVIYANVTKGSAIAYGSAINNTSGDPTYVPGLRARADSHIAFGVDLNGDGTIDIADANGDGVLDQPISLYTIGFPNFFKVVVTGDGAAAAKISLVDTKTSDVLLLDDGQTIEWAPSIETRGKTINLQVKITVNGVSDIVTIPAVVK